MKYKVNNIGAFIKENRLKKDIKLRTLSGYLDITPGYLSKIENGSSKPSSELLKKLTDILEFQLSDVIELPSESSNQLFEGNISIDDLFTAPLISIDGKKLTKLEQFQMLNIIKTIHRIKRYPEIDDLEQMQILLKQILEFKES
ncbi:helix-turn-helix domain-containing protein [Bacillus sp. AL-1R]